MKFTGSISILVVLSLLYSCGGDKATTVNLSESFNSIDIDSAFETPPGKDSSVTYDDFMKYYEYSIPEVSDSLFESIKKQFAQRYGPVKEITVGGETKYVVEGDLLLSRAGFIDHFIVREAERREAKPQAKLMVRSQRGRWLTLKDPSNVPFAIRKSSFRTEDEYKKVRSAVERAVAAWNGMCNVNFVYHSEWDTVLTPGQFPSELFFQIVFDDVAIDFVAGSFFPHWKNASDRVITITRKYFTTKYDPVGVFRHELGHSMGFLHEHLRAPGGAVCPDDAASSYFDASVYDPKSVMHYRCETVGFGSYQLEFTSLDSAGAKLVYPTRP